MPLRRLCRRSQADKQISRVDRAEVTQICPELTPFRASGERRLKLGDHRAIRGTLGSWDSA